MTLIKACLMNTKSNSLLSLIVLILFFGNTQIYAQERAQSAALKAAVAVDDETEIQDNSQEQTTETVVKEIVISPDEFPSESVTPITDNNSDILNKKTQPIPFKNYLFECNALNFHKI